MGPEILRSREPLKAELPGRLVHLRPALIESCPALSSFPRMADATLRTVIAGKPEQIVIFSDVDGTLIAGAGRAPAEVAQARRDADRLVEWVCGAGAILIPITGSSWDLSTSTSPSMSRRMAEGAMPRFQHALITDGGNRAIGHGAAAEEFREDPGFGGFCRKQMERFPAQEVFARAAELAAQLNRSADGCGLKLQPLDFELLRRIDPAVPAQRICFQPHVHGEGRESPDRVCLYFFAGTLHERDRLDRFWRSQFEEWKVVCCEEKDFNNRRDKLEGQGAFDGRAPARRYCLDIVPLDKGAAIDYFHAEIKNALAAAAKLVDAPAPPRVTAWYCGDAGNDLAPAGRPQIDCVCMVSGASRELTRWAPQLRGDGKQVYTFEDSALRCAASILEALRQAAAEGWPGADCT